ncbi:MAG: Mrp/NBP35 family ATP-binding protein [Kordiimonadaceae bacterium]|nr:Mrp/NBP35 family ATP-binding protein [Kordiimonadaceae bacterium]
MSKIAKQAIYDALKGIIPTYANNATKGDLIASGAITTVVIDGSQVGIVLDFGADTPTNADAVRKSAEKAASAVAGVANASVVMSATRKAPNTSLQGNKPQAAKAAPTPTAIPGVKHIIAVASGKGGVGKSTTSVNLALAFQKQGLKVGLLDADIFGPSLPMLVGLNEKPEMKDKVIQPLSAYGLKLMSVGFLIDVDQPVIWRGPRVMGATQQMLKDVAWGPLDVLVVDMPPGTGDVQLTMVQQVPLSGAVIVSTPQDLALIDARKGLAMFRQVNVPILGILENMSQFLCPHCGETSDIFGHGGAADTAADLGCDFLGAIPLHMSIRETGDTGAPIVASDPNGAIAGTYNEIAETLMKTLLV